MNAVVRALFGARAQVAVGSAFVFATAGQTYYWLFVTPPTVRAVFIVSMEALAFASYGIIATGLAVLWLDKRTPEPDTVGSSQREYGEGAK